MIKNIKKLKLLIRFLVSGVSLEYSLSRIKFIEDLENRGLIKYFNK